LEQGTKVQDNAETSTSEYQLEGKEHVGAKNREKKEKSDKENSKEKDADRKGDIEREKVRATDGASLDNLLLRLPRCISRDLIDQLTVTKSGLYTYLDLRWLHLIFKLHLFILSGRVLLSEF
jgi:regulator of nonsense transcripts 2